MSFRELWDAQAEAWGRFARTPGHDVFHEHFNFPAFLELLPPPGRATLDVGCGEGRVGAELARLGHDILGVDASPRMVELARERHPALVADAAALPFDDASFDLVVAYMAFMNVDDLDGSVREIGRVIEPGGRLCFADIHPISAAGRFLGSEPDDPFTIEGSYFEQEPRRWVSERDGIRVTFDDRGYPLERYSRALEGASLAIEALREPVPSDAFIGRHPSAARRRRVPLLLHVRAQKR